MMILHYPFVLSALALCLLLSATLSVFGHHVVRRGVLFVDLALAQVAALGSSAAVLLGWDAHEHPVANFTFALGFTFAGAALFAWFRRRRAPIEALIGITYAGAMAFSLILLEHSATGAEEIREMLVGSILAVTPRELMAAAALCGAAGLLLWFTRRPVFRITEDPRAAAESGLRLGFWDFLFYAAFGVVVTFSVKAAGVLLVFAFLITPSLAGILAASGTRARILFGWGFSLLACLLGMELSLRMDWSAGPSIVAVFILLLVFSGTVSGWIGGKQRHF
jgi:zinc/manganese transport system permease protein